jgi:hypothetical protein
MRIAAAQPNPFAKMGSARQTSRVAKMKIVSQAMSAKTTPVRQPLRAPKKIKAAVAKIATARTAKRVKTKSASRHLAQVTKNAKSAMHPSQSASKENAQRPMSAKPTKTAKNQPSPSAKKESVRLPHAPKSEKNATNSPAKTNCFATPK